MLRQEKKIRVLDLLRFLHEDIENDNFINVDRYLNSIHKIFNEAPSFSRNSGRHSASLAKTNRFQKSYTSSLWKNLKKWKF
jgi:hypothetical protein